MRVFDGVLVGVPAVAGVLVGTRLQQRLQGRTIALLFAVVLVARELRCGERVGGGASRAVEVRRDDRCIVIGLAAGVVAGLLGVGGGVLFVPGLVIFIGLTQHQAEATSLLAIVPVALVGAAAQDRYGNVRRKDALQLGLFSVVGAAAGVALANALSGKALQVGFALFMLFVAGQLVRKNVGTGARSGARAGAREPRWQPKRGLEGGAVRPQPGEPG